LVRLRFDLLKETVGSRMMSIEPAGKLLNLPSPKNCRRRERDAHHRPPIFRAGKLPVVSKWNVCRSVRPISVAIDETSQIRSAPSARAPGFSTISSMICIAYLQ